MTDDKRLWQQAFRGVIVFAIIIFTIMELGQASSVYAQKVSIVSFQAPGQVIAGQNFVVEMIVSFTLQPPQAMIAGVLDSSMNPLPAIVRCSPEACSAEQSLSVMIPTGDPLYPTMPVSGVETVDITLTAPNSETTWNLKVVAAYAQVGSSGNLETHMQPIRSFQVRVVGQQIQSTTVYTTPSTSSQNSVTATEIESTTVSTTEMPSESVQSSPSAPFPEFVIYLVIVGILIAAGFLLLDIRRQAATIHSAGRPRKRKR